MLDLYYWTTPNGHKITIFLEETGLPYRIKPVNISAGEQFAPAFLAIAPNNRIPALVDHEPQDGGEPISLFESGAILQYLARKSGRFGGQSLREETEITQWLMWQMGGLGPMLGQNHHFKTYAPETIPYAIDRYVGETARLYAVLNRRLTDRDYVAGPYSIADMACYPWIVNHKGQGQDLADYPNLKNWFERVGRRTAVKKAYDIADSVNQAPTVTDDARKVLFGQNAKTVRN